MADNTEVQRSATLEEIVADHMVGLSGYAIAEKYSMDTEQIKGILNQANEDGKFIPDTGATDPIVRDSQQPVVTPSAQPLTEGENPKTEVETTDKKK